MADEVVDAELVDDDRLPAAVQPEPLARPLIDRHTMLRPGAPEPPHPGQSRPTPTVDELAAMTRDPQRTAYPDTRSHLLACRTRHSLRRDAGLSPEEKDVRLDVTWARIREERPHFPERRPF